MVHQDEQQQTGSGSPTDITADSTENLEIDDTQQPSPLEPSTSSSESSSTKQKATPPPPLQEELGKTFASRKIQMASLAIRSTHSASQSPLFPRHDVFQLYQKPFVASSLSTPTMPHATATPTHLDSDRPRVLPPHLLPSSSSPPSASDRALLDRTWSVLASKSESNQQQGHRKKPRRRVTFNDNIEFFELPPQMSHYDDTDALPTYSSTPLPPPGVTTETTYMEDNGERQNEYHQVIKNEKQPSLPQIVNQWDEPYTNASNEASSPELQTADIPKQLHSYPAPSSVTSSTSTTSSGSMATLSLSSSSTQSNSIINNSNNNSDGMTPTTNGQQPPLFTQQINTSSSSLPVYNPMASSTTSLALSTSSFPNLTSTGTSSSQRTLQRKGNTISRNAILEILSRRAPSNHHHIASNDTHRRSVKHNSKKLSSQQQLHHQVPINFHHTLDSVENEIKVAIQRAKASRADQNAALAAGSPSKNNTTTNNKQLHDVDEQIPDEEARNIITKTTTAGDNNNGVGDAQGMDATKDSNDNDNNQRQVSESITGMDQLYSEDDSDSNTLHGENNSNETVYVDAEAGQGDDDGCNEPPYNNTTLDKLSSPHNSDNSSSSNSDSYNGEHNDCDESSRNENDITDTEDNHVSNSLLVYLPSPEQQISDFGASLQDEFDRITGNMMIVSSSELTNVTMENCELEENVSALNITQDHSLCRTATNIHIDDQEQSNSSIPWRILNCQEENDTPIKTHQPEFGPPQDSAANGRLYIKVIAAANLDFPINPNAPSIQCSVNDGSHYLGSGHHKMQHDINFNHEFILDNINPDSELTLTLHAIRPDDQNAGTSPTKRWSKRTSFGAGGGGSGVNSYRADDLSRYVNSEDGALAQTRVSLSAVSCHCHTKVCTVSSALVNGWYQPVKKSNTRYPLLLSRSTKEKRHVVVQEKAVGKLTMELFYLPNVKAEVADLPVDMDSCEKAVNIQRFHQTVWLSGYMSQLGGDVKYWRRRYFKLIGGKLYSYTDTHYSPRTMIDLSKAVTIASDNRIVTRTNSAIRGRQGQQNRQHQSQSSLHQGNEGGLENNVGHALLLELESRNNINNTMEREHHQSSPVRNPRNGNANGMAENAHLLEPSTVADGGGGGSSMCPHTTASHCCPRTPLDDDGLSSYSVKNGFQLIFENGEMIEFCCDSAHERERWLGILKGILGRIPALPSWL